MSTATKWSDKTSVHYLHRSITNQRDAHLMPFPYFRIIRKASTSTIVLTGYLRSCVTTNSFPRAISHRFKSASKNCWIHRNHSRKHRAFGLWDLYNFDLAVAGIPALAVGPTWEISIRGMLPQHTKSTTSFPYGRTMDTARFYDSRDRITHCSKCAMFQQPPITVSEAKPRFDYFVYLTYYFIFFHCPFSYSDPLSFSSLYFVGRAEGSASKLLTLKIWFIKSKNGPTC